MSKNKKLGRATVLIAGFVILPVIFLYCHIENVEAGLRQDAPLPVQFQVHPQTGIRVVCNGTVVSSSIGGQFFIYKRHLDGSRDLIMQGPWRGESKPHLKEHSANHYSVTGQNGKSGESYAIDYRIDGDNTIRIKHSFIAPGNLAAVEYELLNLPGDLFRGAAISSDSKSPADAGTLPYNPQPESKRFLMKSKNTLTINGTFCDVEVKDISGAHGINVADFRNISWGSIKGFYIYNNAQLIIPGKPYTFEYAVRFYPSSGKTQPYVAMNNSFSYQEAHYTGQFFAMLPKSLTSMPGEYTLSDNVTVYSELHNVGAICADEIEKISGIKLRRVTAKQTTGNGGIIISIDNRKNSDLPEEGFEILINNQSIIIRGRDERGCLYGVYALLDRLVHEGSSWHIPCGMIRDWPDVKVRAHMTEIMKTYIRDVPMFKRYLSAISRARGNTVIFYFYPRHIKGWKTGSDVRWWTKKEMTDIAAYAKSLSLDVWAGMCVQVDPKHDPEFDIINGSNFYNAFNPKSYDTLFNYYQEIIETCKPSTFLIGHDEIMGLLQYAAKSGRHPSDILADDINKIHQWLREKNIRTAVWGDMFLDNKAGKYSSANSRNPALNSGETHQAIERISKEIIIMDWHYQESDTYPSIQYFQGKGFQVVGSVWQTPAAAQKMATNVKMNNALGISSIDWGFWFTLSPAATTMYASLCGWSTQHGVDDKGLDVLALADSLNIHRMDKSMQQIPVDLGGNVNVSAWDVGKGNGIFNKGPLFDLRQFPEGNQKFRNYRFVIPDSRQGSANNVIAIDQKKSKSSKYTVPKKSIAIQGQHAEAVAFLHTCYFDVPNDSPRKIGCYEIEYEDGSSHRVDLIEGWNIRDVRSNSDGRPKGWNRYRFPDVLDGAYLAWRGQTTSGIPLSLNVFVMENPFPSKLISKVNIYTEPLEYPYRLAILGVTLVK